MIANLAFSQSKAQARSATTWVVAAALVLALLVAAPWAFAEESPERFSSQAEAIEFYVDQAEQGLAGSEDVSFSSQAEAIEFYAAQAEQDLAVSEDVSFSSQAEAIDYYLARLQCESGSVAKASFSSQAEAIEFYVARAQENWTWDALSQVCTVAGS